MKNLRDRWTTLSGNIARPWRHWRSDNLPDGGAGSVHPLPLVDGNKRTGITCAVLFLRQNGISLSATNAELEKFTLQVASSKAGRSEIAKWLKSHHS